MSAQLRCVWKGCGLGATARSPVLPYAVRFLDSSHAATSLFA
jgi:hypothetical protein